MLDWIKISCDLPEKWQTLQLRRNLKLRTVDEVVGKLFRLWRHFENQSRAGTIPGVTGDDLDAIVGKKGFSAALIAVGWLELSADGGATVPNFEEYMGAAARARDAEAEKKRAQRERAAAEAATQSGTTNGQTGDSKGGAAGTEPGQPGGQTGDTTGTDGGTGTGPKRERKSKSIPPPSEEDGGLLPAAPKSPAKATPDTPHHQAVAYFTTGWQSRYGQKYPFNGGKDGEAVRWVLAQVDQNETTFRRIIDRYLADDDEFVAKNRHTLGTLRSQLARWLTDPPPVRAPARPPGRVDPGQTRTDYVMGAIEDALSDD